MKNVAHAFFFISLLILTACSTGGGAPEDNIIETRSIHGMIKGDYYFAPGNQFSVKVSHPPSISSDEMFEWMHSHLRDFEDEHSLGVIFGPAAIDRSVHTLTLTTHPLRGDAERSSRNLFAQALDQHGGNFTELKFEAGNINGKPMFYAVYENKERFVVMANIDNDQNYFFIESHITKDSTPPGFHLDMLTKRKWTLFNRMLESFQAPAMPQT